MAGWPELIRELRRVSRLLFVVALIGRGLAARLRLLVQAGRLRLADRGSGGGSGGLQCGVVLLMAWPVVVMSLTPAVTSGCVAPWARRGACCAGAAGLSRGICRLRGRVMVQAAPQNLQNGMDHVRNRRRGLRTLVNQLIYDALLLLQHRGQDAAGIVTTAGNASSSCTRPAAWCATCSARATCALPGGRPRPGALPDGGQRLQRGGGGAALLRQRAVRHRAGAQRQPDQRAQALKAELFDVDHRHINTESDTEVLINVLAHELERAARDRR